MLTTIAVDHLIWWAERAPKTHQQAVVEVINDIQLYHPETVVNGKVMTKIINQVSEKFSK